MRALPEKGFALVTAILLFGVASAFGLALLNHATSGTRAARRLSESISAAQIAEAGVNKAIYCLNATSGANCGGSYGTAYAGETDVAYGNGKFTCNLAGNGLTRTITSVGSTVAGNQVTIKVTASLDPINPQSFGFNYAVQVGDGGVVMQNNAYVDDDGDMYTDSDVNCGNNASVLRDVYISRIGGTVNNCDVGRDARADKILNSSVVRNAYFKNDPADITGTSVGGTKYANSITPAQRPSPTLDVKYWRQVAEDGGIIDGNFSPTDGSSLGPIKITGDLTLNNNVDVTVKGPLWVVGTIKLNNNATLILDAGYGAASTVVVGDNPINTAAGGKIILSNNSAVRGSGNSASFIVLYTTNNSMNDLDAAIQISNNAEGGIFMAPNGAIRLNNLAAASAVLGKRVYMDQNSLIEYTDIGEDPAAVTITSLPGGTWRLVYGTWRQF